jgi:hypothetical protein
MLVICLFAVAGGSNHSMEGTNHVLGEMASDLDAATTPPVLRNSFHPHRTNHDRCYVGVCGSYPHSHSKRWSDPHVMGQPLQPNSYYSLPKNLHPEIGKGPKLGASATSQMEDSKDGSVMMEEDTDEELVPCIRALGVQ